MSGGGKDGPDAPNYARIAEKTAESNYKYGLKGLEQNRINQVGPYGSTGYTRDANGNWTFNTNLSPEQQAIFNQNQAFTGNAAGLATQGLNAAGGLLGNPMINQSLLPASQINPGQTAQDAIMARLSPEFDRQTASLETQLRNQGVMPGSEAYNNAMDAMGRDQNDAMMQAALQGIDVGQRARLQGITEQQQFLNTPLNVASQLRNLGAATIPTQQSIPLLGQTQGVDYSGAAQNQYAANMNQFNAQQAQQQSLMNGLMGAGMLMFSDVRLKSNIEKVGELENGLGVYDYDIFGHRERGVLAQEVLEKIPSAVHVHDSGYLMVDYGAI